MSKKEEKWLCITISRITGSLGILVLAKEKGLLSEISPLIEKLKNSNIYFSENLLKQALTLANEN